MKKRFIDAFNRFLNVMAKTVQGTGWANEFLNEGPDFSQ
jgi:hypothetical protein